MRIGKFRLAASALLLAGASTMAGCATPTAYAPAVGYGQNATGYSDRQVERDRFMVSFAGNGITSRDTVERYLLFRSAQLTIEQGGDYFVLADRDTQRRTQSYIDRPFYSGPYGYWGANWRYYGRGFGWRGYDPFFGGDPFWDRQIDIRTVERFQANAEIVIGHGPKPRDNMRAFDARSVIDNLGPSIVTPQDMARRN